MTPTRKEEFSLTQFFLFLPYSDRIGAEERKPTQLPTLISEALVAILNEITFLAILIAAPHLTFLSGKELNPHSSLPPTALTPKVTRASST